MPVIVVGNERDFAALRPRLFSGRVSAKTATEAAEALRKANPHADLDDLKEGTVLTIPEDASGIAVRGELSLAGTMKEAVLGLANAGAGALDGLAGTAKRRESEVAAERREAARSLGAKEVADAAKRDKGLAAEVDAARAAIAEEEERARERKAALTKAQKEWKSELEALRGLLE